MGSLEYSLEDLRKSLDAIDSALVSLLAERFRITHKVGLYKKENNLLPVDKVRETAQYARIAKLAKEAGLDPEFAAKMLRLVIREVVEHHRNIRRT